LKQKRDINQSKKYIDNIYLRLCKKLFPHREFMSIKKQHTNNYKKGNWLPKGRTTKSSPRISAD